MPLSPSGVCRDQNIMMSKRKVERKCIEEGMKENNKKEKIKQKKCKSQDNRNITLLKKKKELKRVLLIRQPLSINLCRDLYIHSHLEILPSYTLHSMVPWKEENHDLHLETLYSSGLIPSFRLPYLHYIGDLSCLPSSTLSPIEVSHLLHGFACMLYQYGASLLSSLF